MKTNKLSFVDLGLLTMPLFCSLLGAILVLNLGNVSASRPPVSREKIQGLLSRLAQARSAMARSVAIQQVVSSRLDLAEYRGANAKLDAQITQRLQEVAKLTNAVSEAQLLQGRLDELRRQAETSAVDVAEARRRIRELEARVQAEAQAEATNLAVALHGRYRGSLVLIECDGEGSTIHPSGRKLAVDAPEREFDSVFAQVASAGFVAVVARPSGFARSYGRIRHLVDERIDAMNKGRQNPIGLCAFPLDANASLTGILPKGGPR